MVKKGTQRLVVAAVVVVGSVVGCPLVPVSDAGFVPRADTRQRRVETQKIEEAAEEQYNPKVMHDGLFQQLKIH